MLLNASSLLELELDFAEEDLEFISYEKVKKDIKLILTDINKLISSYRVGKIIRDGINVVLVGKTNVGKSSILNYLVKESRAIVSHVPGTTRDIITEEVSLDGMLFKIFDTAGIRITEDEIEKEGVERSRRAVEEADIVVLINDVSSEFPKQLYKRIVIFNNQRKNNSIR